MKIAIQPPQAPQGNSEKQLLQIYSYLFQMSKQLNIALNSLSADSYYSDSTQSIQTTTLASKTGDMSEYNALRAMIVKTAKTVETQMDVITAELQSGYLAKSEFGEYSSQTSNTITATAEAVTQEYKQQDKIISDSLEDYKKEISGYIKTGILDTDGTIGVEVGQSEDFKARFTSERLSFYQNGSEVAYVSNNKLYITHATIKGTLQIGPFQLDTSNGLIIRYVGKE